MIDQKKRTKAEDIVGESEKAFDEQTRRELVNTEYSLQEKSIM